MNRPHQLLSLLFADSLITYKTNNNAVRLFSGSFGDLLAYLSHENIAGKSNKKYTLTLCRKASKNEGKLAWITLITGNVLNVWICNFVLPTG